MKPQTDPNHKNSAEQYAAVQEKTSQFGIEKWTDRFLKVLQQSRSSKNLQERPLIFICHSTGGIVVKRALCNKLSETESSLAAVCIGILFFGVYLYPLAQW